MRRSIRWRLAVWYSVALAAALLLFGVLIRFSLERRLLSEMDEELSGRVIRFENYFLVESAEIRSGDLVDELAEFCAALPPGSSIELTGPRGLFFRYPKNPGTGARFRTLERTFADRNGVPLRIVAGESMKPIRHTIALLQFELFTLAPFAMLIACLGGWLLSRRALKPVADIANTAHAISIENLSVRLEIPRTGDELERLAEAFNTMLARLEAAVATLSQFVADASHELRTPLAVIRASAEIALRRARTADSYRESIAGIAEEAERMTALVEDLLFLARSDAGSAALPGAEEDLCAIVRQAARAVEPLARGRGIRIIGFEPGMAPVMAPANRAALERMFTALLDNAIKYSPNDGRIDVEFHVADSRAAISISDGGPGIEPADLPHIFKRFYRADKARTGQGYGLGLSIAENIARAHGALIEASGAPGAGSTFTVTFPCVHQCAGSAQAESVAAQTR